MPRLLWLFCLVNLVIGSGACVLGGILVPMARDLAISAPTAGQAITAHALSTAPARADDAAGHRALLVGRQT